jgi:hypothetical protein
MGKIIKFFWNGGAVIFWGFLILGSPFWLFPLLMVSGGCALTEHELFLSPDKEKEAVVLIRNCGATTNWETQVVVRDITDIENQNILIRLDGHPETIDYKVSWELDGTVVITDFNFKDLLSFHSRNLTSDIARSVIRPKAS